MTTSADVRARLIHALRLDLVGPEPDDPQVNEVLAAPPSRWYLTGFLAPSSAPAAQKQDEDAQGELELTEAGRAGDDDDSEPGPQAARRGQFPSSLGVSVLVSPDANELRVRARWGDYEPREVGARPDVEWDRRERTGVVVVRLAGDGALPAVAPVPDSNGLEVVTSVRRIRKPQNLVGLALGTRAVSVFLVNRRVPIEGKDELKDSRFAFQASLTVETDAPFVARPNPRGRGTNDPDERIADLQYRDVMEYAVGHGTSTRASVVDGHCHKAETVWIPEAEVERVEPARMQGVELSMEALAAMPTAAAVRTSLGKLTADYRRWIEEQKAGAPRSGPRGEVAAALLQRAGLAADRIDAGLALLEDSAVFEAFKLANRAMATAARQRRAQERGVAPESVEAPAWRPFQLAFVLMNLRAFVSPTHPDREIVDLLFFPTGGGKTEAYLGLAAFAILLRRLRDPSLASCGVTVLMRYTLRLLTLDQLGRAATLVCAMELIRQEPGMANRLGTWPFEIGLWVGKAATPNRMGRVGEKDQTTARAKTISFRNNSRRAAPIPIETCPWCGGRFKPESFQLGKTLPDGSWRSDANEPQDLRVVCVNAACRFKGRNPLPIVAVDEPLYRRVPCFVIATVDKFASLPWTGASGALLGGADRYDAAGFYGAWEPGVGSALPQPLPPPELIIQDELHLISGPLGTMAGLYEAAIDSLCSRTDGGHVVRPKIVASTATVRRADAQIQALFTRAGVEVFPPPGPDRRASFFAETVPLASKPGRRYAGIAAQGRSLKVVLLRTYLALLGGAERSWREAGGAKDPANPADPYMTLVGYFNSLRELGGSRRIVEDEVASRVLAYGSRSRVGENEGSFADREISRDVCELTSRESTDRVANTKRRLAIGFTDKEKAKDRIDVALATNMISVGLDITRLGLMVVLGQPKAAAEYIQATSRVGRDEAKPGLVVTLLNVHRPRDRSHYERFTAFHESFYRAVEATSVTPFAPRALDRALPALVVALARHGRRVLTPPRGALAVAGERPGLDSIGAVLAERARRHRALSAEEEARINAYLTGRASDLLDSWVRVARRQQDVGARLVYQRNEMADGKALLRQPLEDPDPDLGQDGRKFKAPRSLRDVEPSVNVFVKQLDGVEIEMPTETDAP
jgi:hypothetical protein